MQRVSPQLCAILSKKTQELQFFIVKVKSESNFLVLYFFQTFICCEGIFNLNCDMGEKVQKNFLMGLKILGKPTDTTLFRFTQVFFYLKILGKPTDTTLFRSN